MCVVYFWKKRAKKTKKKNDIKKLHFKKILNL